MRTATAIAANIRTTITSAVIIAAVFVLFSTVSS